MEKHLPWHECSEGSVSVAQAQRGSSQSQFNVLVSFHGTGTMRNAWSVVLCYQNPTGKCSEESLNQSQSMCGVAGRRRWYSHTRLCIHLWAFSWGVCPRQRVSSTMWTQQKFIISGISVSVEEALGAWSCGGSVDVCTAGASNNPCLKVLQGSKTRVFQGRGCLPRCAAMCLGLLQGAWAWGETLGNSEALFVKPQ